MTVQSKKIKPGHEEMPLPCKQQEKKETEHDPRPMVFP
jgi:hypothetical protein